MSRAAGAPWPFDGDEASQTVRPGGRRPRPPGHAPPQSAAWPRPRGSDPPASSARQRGRREDARPGRMVRGLQLCPRWSWRAGIALADPATLTFLLLSSQPGPEERSGRVSGVWRRAAASRAPVGAEAGRFDHRSDRPAPCGGAAPVASAKAMVRRMPPRAIQPSWAASRAASRASFAAGRRRGGAVATVW